MVRRLEASVQCRRWVNCEKLDVRLSGPLLLRERTLERTCRLARFVP